MSAPIVQSKLYRCDYAGNRLEDVSDIVIEVRASCNPENDQTWQLDATVRWDAYRELIAPYLDPERPDLVWIAPELTVTWPNGVVRQGQIGLYLIMESPVKHTETSATVALRAFDPLWLLARQGLKKRLELRENTSKDRALRVILDNAVLTDDPNGRRRFAIPESNHRFRKDSEYPKDWNTLEVANQLAQGMGCYNLWATGLGVVTTKRMGEARLRNRTPVKTYSAHVPASVVLAGHQLSLNHPFSEIVGTVDTAPYDESLLNEILIVNDDPGLPRIHVKRRVNNPRNRRHALMRRQRRRERRIRNRLLDDEATAGEVAEALLDELSTRNRTARLTVMPDPEPSFIRETIDCFVWDAWGNEVLTGQYAVHGASYTFRPSDNSGLMTLDIGRIDDAEGAAEYDEDEAA